MAIDFFSLTNVFGPLQALLAWMAGPRPAPVAAAPVRAAHRVAPRVPARPGTRSAWAGPVRAPLRPLRVVRVVEANAARSVAGRMVISGRFADVCAELDRMAAQEARGHENDVNRAAHRADRFPLR